MVRVKHSRRCQPARHEYPAPVLSSPSLARMRAPLGVFAVCAAIYVATLGSRVRGPSDNTHFVSLAESYLHRQLSVVGDRPPGDNDWAHYREHWYVVFPPLPALVILPAVAIWHSALWDRLFWAIFAGLGPALLYVLLRRLREERGSGRSAHEDLALTALFAFGSAYYYTAVQGTVWFAAHVVACPLIALYALWSLGARRPLLAGLALGLCIATRPSTGGLALLFVIEALDQTRAPLPVDPQASPLTRFWQWLRSCSTRAAIPKLALFALPILISVAISCWLNQRRFGDPFEVGYRYLRIRWSARIETWGLFNYHYLAKNLAVFLAALPWLSAAAPYLRVSRHGLALWVTTPQYLLVLWPKRRSVLLQALAISAASVALLDLCYQNSGWIQYGYRFSLDYSVLLCALLALGGRRFGLGFYALLLIACAINLFGALTFDRVPRFYDDDASQQVIFQPD
jgi:hypothetical protein